MADQYRDSCVKRQSKNRGKEDPIRVSFFDKDGQLIDDVTRKEANCVASRNPSQLFYFQDANGLRKELLINDVNKLTVNDATIPSVPRCPTSPQLCGPPKVRFFSGGGFGALANAIVSPNSASVIGFDIVNPGFNYLSPPWAYLEDDCGKGSGGSLLVQTKPSLKGGLEVKNIVVTAPGDGYIAAPDGSLGGNGRVFVDVGDAYVEKGDGTVYPVPGGDLPPDLQPDDKFIPVNPIPQPPPVFPQPQPPSPQPEQPITYPVVLEIEEVYVYDPGFGYVPGDTITVEKGAVLEPVINDRGEIESVKVINGGIGFVDIPLLTINSNTGYNARLIPVLRPIQIPTQEPTLPPPVPSPEGGIPIQIPPGTQIISVVDCVGKIPPKSNFDIVPR